MLPRMTKLMSRFHLTSKTLEVAPNYQVGGNISKKKKKMNEINALALTKGRQVV